jgi:hypothetical protein
VPIDVDGEITAASWRHRGGIAVKKRRHVPALVR